MRDLSSHKDPGIITQARLKELSHYDPITGIFINRVGRKGSAKGRILGAKYSRGYLNTLLDRKTYLLHRLAFLYMEGYFPEYCVDHINGIPSDNRWKNLRHVTPQCNAQNRKLSKSNVSGFPGVSIRLNRVTWQAGGTYKGKNINLGTYKTSLDAALARFTWELQCAEWQCNAQAVIYRMIKEHWPEFKPF